MSKNPRHSPMTEETLQNSNNFSSNSSCDDPNNDQECVGSQYTCIDDVTKSKVSSFEDSEKDLAESVCHHNCGEKILSIVKDWSSKENLVSKVSITRLLTQINASFPKVPKTYHGLHRYEKPAVEVMKPGEYVHFCKWTQHVKDVMDNFLDEAGNKSFNLCFNVDEIPLFNNSRFYNAYPILVKFIDIPEKIIVAGIYCTNKKDNNLPLPDVFLRKFINDLVDLKSERPCVNLGPFICDAPMRSYLKQIVSHTSYNSCERCIQEGTYNGGHVTLLDLDANLRDGKSFNEKKDKYHHKSNESTFLESKLNFDLVESFTLNYMHLCCLGVMKRLLLRLSKSTAN